MTDLLREALLVAEYFSDYDKALFDSALRTKGQVSAVQSKELNRLYNRLAKQVRKVEELQRQGG